MIIKNDLNRVISRLLIKNRDAVIIKIAVVFIMPLTGGKQKRDYTIDKCMAHLMLSDYC